MRTLVELDEDIVCDLRINNGRPPKFEDFWSIVDDVIKRPRWMIAGMPLRSMMEKMYWLI